MATTEITTVVDRYIAGWNEPDEARRAEHVKAAFAEGATYVDPLMAGQGHDQLVDMIGAAQAQYPGHSFRLSFGPDAHNDRVRFSWTLVADQSGTAVAVGHDFATLDPDGRLREVTGFLETPAA